MKKPKVTELNFNMYGCLIHVLFSLVAFSESMETTTSSQSTCTYTFNVPNNDQSTCPPGATASDVTTLRDFIRNEHTALEEKLDAIIDRLTARSDTGPEIIHTRDNSSDSNTGINYVRWGRTTCPGTAQLIYEGYVGKSHYNHGGGSNYLCLASDPEFPEGATLNRQSTADIYGVEYRQSNNPLISDDIHVQNVPCAVCEARRRNQVLMIPGKVSCPQDWTEEYHGLLMSQQNGMKSADYICVAEGMETVDGGSTVQSAGLLYVVEAYCGALPCPPYQHGYEIGCAVCTK